MIKNIVNRIEKLDSELSKKIANISNIYSDDRIPINKTKYYIKKYDDMSQMNKPRNILTYETILYDNTTIPEIVLNGTYLAVNGKGYNIANLYPFYAITEGCRYLLNYNYKDYPVYKCNCVVFDLANFTGQPVAEFGETFTSHYDFIKYIKKKYGFAKSLYISDVLGNGISSGLMNMCNKPLKVDKVHNREEIVFKYGSEYYVTSIPMLDLKALIFSINITKNCNVTDINFDQYSGNPIEVSYEFKSYAEFNRLGFTNIEEVKNKYHSNELFKESNRYIVLDDYILIYSPIRRYPEHYYNYSIMSIKYSGKTLLTDSFAYVHHQLNPELNYFKIEAFNKIIFVYNRGYSIFDYTTGKSIEHGTLSESIKMYGNNCTYNITNSGLFNIFDSNGTKQISIYILDGTNSI